MLREQIEDAYESALAEKITPGIRDTFRRFKEALNSGHIRAAEKKDNRWLVNQWVKKGILLGFRIGKPADVSIDARFVYYDKDTYPLKHIAIGDHVRIVPGGSAIRDGCYIGKNVTCMPPMYINVGAYVDDGTMIDSHALVGSCAQIGKRVHLSAGAQIGGVLEPVGAMPVVIEDDVLVGGNCGVYEGTVVRKGAVLAAGTILTGGTPVFDLVHDAVYRRTEEMPLEIPENAVVVPGSRPVKAETGKQRGIAVYCPVIIKYRDEKTGGSVQLEQMLR